MAIMTSDQTIVRGQRVKSVKVERARELRLDMTQAERLLWHRLRGSRLDGLRWRRQQIIGGFIVDFYCHTAKVIVELDGAIYEQQAEYDATRDEVLATGNLLILRFTNTAVISNINSVLVDIREACQQRIHP